MKTFSFSRDKSKTRNVVFQVSSTVYYYISSGKKQGREYLHLEGKEKRKLRTEPGVLLSEETMEVQQVTRNFTAKK